MPLFRILLLQLNVMLNDLQRFSLLHRFMALMIDHLVLMVIFTVLLLITGNSSAALWSGRMDADQVLSLMFYAVLAFFLLNSRLLFERGQSIGKRVMSLQIVSQDGRPVSRIQILKRFAFFWGIWLIPVYGIPLAFVECLYAVTGPRGAGHDRFAGTAVVSILSDSLSGTQDQKDDDPEADR